MRSRGRSCSWLAVGLVAALAAGCTTTTLPVGEADRALTTAEAQLAAQDYDGVIDTLDPLAEEACPKRLRDRRDVALARAHFAQEKYWEAFKVLRSFAADHPHSELRPQVGELIWEIGTRLAGSDGGFWIFWSDRSAGRIALEHLRTSHPESPHSADALRILGDLAFEDEEYVNAQDRFRELMLNHPDSEWAGYAQYRFAMSIVASVRGMEYDLENMELAVKELKAFLATQPENPEQMRTAGEALAQLQEWRIARHIYIADFYRTVGNAPGEHLHVGRAADDEFTTTSRHAEAVARRAALAAPVPGGP